jgi:hypothetical protein
MEWSVTSHKFAPLDASDTWESFEPMSIDYKYIFAEAQRQGWINPAKRYQLDTAQTQTQETGWPEPQKLPGELRSVMELDPDWLPESIREGCLDTAERLNCPLEYVAIPVIISAGTALGIQLAYGQKNLMSLGWFTQAFGARSLDHQDQ